MFGHELCNPDDGHAELYTLLGVERNASTTDIKRAYKELSRTFHPDKAKTSKLVERLLEIQTAHEILTDECLRRHYDLHGFDGLDVAKAVRAQMLKEEEEESSSNALDGPPGQLVKIGPNYLEDFERRVRQSQYLIEDIYLHRLSGANSQMRLGICCFAFNPFSHVRPPPIYSTRCWKYNEASVQQSMTFTSPNQTCSITLAWILGHRRKQKQSLLPKSPSHLTSPLQSQPSRNELIWGRTALSVSYPLSPSMGSALEASIDNGKAAGKIGATVHRTFKNASTIALRHSYDIPSPYLRSESYSASTTVEWDTPIGKSGSGTMLCSFGQISLLSLIWKETKSRLGHIATRLDLSTFDVLMGFQWSSRSLDPPQWRSPKSSKKIKKRKHVRLPGYDFANKGETRVAISSNVGLMSGINLRVNYTLFLDWLDPFMILRYSIRWKPLSKELSIAFRFERLGTTLDLPVLLAWPTSTILTETSTSKTSPQSFNDEVIANINLSNLFLWMPTSSAIIASAVLWSTVCGVAALPIVLHRIWIDVFAESLLLKETVLKIRNAINALHQHSYRALGISPNSSQISLPMSSTSDSIALERAILEQNALQPTADRIRKIEKMLHGLVIEKAIYGSLNDITMSHRIDGKSNQSSTNPSTTSLSPLHYERCKPGDSTFIDSLSPQLQQLSEFHLDVTIPLMSMVRNSRLTIFGNISKRYLPGFSGFDHIDHYLFIKYTYGKKSYKGIFSDFEIIMLP